ncbi:MAG: hypothetical protein K9G76_02860 [Bacteroidales bacterium]|nr:hypothetical protein [Bacteroidales bacterium]MCF8402734.1 hypothetical protein [Bacteroidales bacterium]
MKIISTVKLSVFLSFLIFLGLGCSSRFDQPVKEDESSLQFLPLNDNDLSSTIHLCREIDKETGEMIGEGNVFTPMEGAWLRAIVGLKNRNYYEGKTLMFHFDWIGTSGYSIYQKRTDLLPADSASELYSSISLSPDSREAGAYILRLYLFRELISEKKFTILPEFNPEDYQADGPLVNIILYRKISRKTGKRIGEGTDFEMGKKEKVRALIEVENRFIKDQELVFQLDWIGPDSKSFYDKEICLYPGDSNLVINSSISILPGKRDPGEYKLQLNLFHKLIAEKTFLILP